jgi:hypothetical protein
VEVVLDEWVGGWLVVMGFDEVGVREEGAGKGRLRRLVEGGYIDGLLHKVRKCRVPIHKSSVLWFIWNDRFFSNDCSCSINLRKPRIVILCDIIQ